MCGVEFISNVCDVSIYPHLFGRDKVKQGERSCMLFALLDCEYGIVLILSILVYTFFSRMFDLMLPPVAKHSIVVA